MGAAPGKCEAESCAPMAQQWPSNLFASSVIPPRTSQVLLWGLGPQQRLYGCVLQQLLCLKFCRCCCRFHVPWCGSPATAVVNRAFTTLGSWGGPRVSRTDAVPLVCPL